jgi:hypothetical protein
LRRALLTAALALSIAAPAQADTFQVNTNVDTGTCTAVACSLRGAITAAQTNGTAVTDTINVPAGTYATPEVVLGGAGSNITVVGAGAGSTVWEPSGQTRVLSLTQPSGTGPTNVSLRNLSVRNGRSATTGGYILLNSASSLSVVGVRVMGGQALAGGGIHVQTGGSATTLNVTDSLIDHNTATGTSTSGPGEGGGGIFVEGQTFGSSVTLTDSTIAFNTAVRGGGLQGAFGSAVVMRGATIAFNTATGTGTAGALQGNSSVTALGSIIANNTPVNCLAALPVADQGGNVENTNQCDLAAPASKPSTDPLLALGLDETLQPPTLNIPGTSPAVDFATCDASRPTDQRGLPRSLGVRCDSGAYEFDPRPDTSIQGSALPLTLVSTDAGSTFECDLDGAGFVPCASPYNPVVAPGTHTLSVRATDPQGNVDPTPATTTFTVAQPPTPTPTASATATPTPTATPVAGRTVVVRESRGTVKVKLKGTSRFVDLDASTGIPVGSEVDTRKGRVELISVPKAGAPPEKATFYDGIFRVAQSRGITTLTLTQKLAACPRKGQAAAAAKKPKVRRLWGDGKGRFRTSGKYSAATVRGTKWLVQDSCAGTLTRVTQGAVTVTDGRKRVIVRAGKRYLAKARR